MGRKFGAITETTSAASAESGEPPATAGNESPAGRTEAFWYIGLDAVTDTATIQPWMWNPLKRKWHKSGDTIDIVGSDIVLVYTNGAGGRTFMQITAGTTFPVTRDVQYLEKEA